MRNSRSLQLISSVGKLRLSDFGEALPKREAIERVESQAGKDLDTIFELAVDAPEEPTLLVFCSCKRRRIGNAPVCSDWLTRPYRTLLGCRLVAYRDNEI